MKRREVRERDEAAERERLEARTEGLLAQLRAQQEARKRPTAVPAEPPAEPSADEQPEPVHQLAEATESADTDEG